MITEAPQASQPAKLNFQVEVFIRKMGTTALQAAEPPEPLSGRPEAEISSFESGF